MENFQNLNKCVVQINMLDENYQKSDEFASEKIGYSFCFQDKLTNICFHFKDFQVSTDIIWQVFKKLQKFCEKSALFINVLLQIIMLVRKFYRI